MSIKLMTAVWDGSELRGSDLLVMLALADYANDDGECWPSVARIAERARIKPRAVQYILAKLETAGLLSRDTTGGRSRTTRFVLHIKGARDCTHSEPERVQDSAQRVQNDGLKGAKPIAPEPSGTVKEPSSPPSPPRGESADFDHFWSLCPRRVGKGAARRAFERARKKADAEAILAGMRRHASDMAGKEQRFIPHPATWLNQERWTDEVPEQPKWEIWGVKPDEPDDGGNFSRGGDQPPPAPRNAADNVSELFPHPAKESRPVSQRDLQAGRGGLAVLAL